MSEIKTNVLHLRPGPLPTNPQNGQIAIDSGDGDKVKKYSSTTASWSQISGGGSGGINYVANPDFESSTTGYAAYADAAGAAPVDGTGGSPVLTITRTTSSPLRDLASGLITKDASNRQGNGVSYDFSIAAADQAKVLSISFDYAIASGTFVGGTDAAVGDLVLYVYDVTNAVLIQPSAFKILGSVSGQFYKHQATFQSNSNSTSYRLIWHVATTSASAWTVKVDNVQVGPQSVLFGSPTTDPVAYTPVFQGFGTPTSVNITSWRSGKYLFVEGSFVAGTTTAAEARIGLGYNGVAGNVTVDPTALPAIRTVGKVAVSNLAARDYQVLSEPSATYLTIGYQESTTTSALTKQNGNAINSSGNTFTFFARVPIAGWGSSVQMSNDTETRVVAMSAQLAATSLSNNTETTLTAWTTQFDTHGAFSSGIFTAPVSGIFEISGAVIFTANATGTRYATFQKNGATTVAIAQISTAASGTVDAQIVLPGLLVSLNAGDTLRMRAFQNSGGALSLQTGSNTTLSIRRLSGPTAIAATESVSMQASSGAIGSVSSGNVMVFATKVIDSHGGYSTGTGRYTVPTSGKFCVTCTLTQASGTPTIAVYKNASLANYLFSLTSGTGVRSGSVIMNLLAGDIIDIRPDATTTTGASENRFEIFRIGN